MPKRISWLIGSLFCAILFTAGTVKANTVDLITNGGFETSDFTGWTHTSNVSANNYADYYVGDPLTTVAYGLPLGPASGSYFAYSDENAASQMALLQTFTVPVGATSVTLSFDMFTDNFNVNGLSQSSNLGTICGTGIGALDISSGNQCARVDILSALATPFDTGSGVVQNVYNDASLVALDTNNNNNPIPNPYVHYTDNLTGLGPGTYQLRFATVSTQFYINQGIDNVSILATTGTSVPEPSTLVLLGVGLFGLALASSLKRKGVCSSSISA